MQYMGKEYGKHQDLKNIAKVNVRSQVSFKKDKDGQWRGTVTLENISRVPAIMIRLNVVGKKTRKDVYENNVGWLRILEFMPDGKTVKVRTYSPLFGISPLTDILHTEPLILTNSIL